LATNMAARKEDAGTISSEIALWRSLYSKDAAQLADRDHVDYTVTRIKKLNLGILEGQAVADAYSIAGRKADADRERKAVENKASADVLRMSLGSMVMIMAFLTGTATLILAVVAAAKRKWGWIGRVEPQELSSSTDIPATPSFGSLLDIFVAYLAISRGVGLLVGVIPFFDSLPNVPLTAGVYIGTALLAAIYMTSCAKAEGWRLADIGLRSPGGLPKDILYGMVGYCGALPLVVAAGLINARFIKREDSSLTPNPVLPMIAGEGSDIGRIILFCLVAIAAPIFEELFFRGVLYSALKTRFNTAACILISGACFAIVHPMGDWLPIFALGCALASVRELRLSLIPGMVMHFCQNSLAFIVMRMMFS
ncbi:MAG: CPBP family intramembrane metalloprotease, partial [Oxalobacteraceae bacterium]